MKANKAPEKIYLLPRQGGDYAPYWKTDSQDGFGIEYIQADAFIEKACEFIEQNITGYIDVTHNGGEENIILQSEFINYFKEFMRND